VNEYDQACKVAVRAVDPLGFLRWVLPAKIVAPYDFERWLPTETLAMPGEPDRHCDTVVGLSHRAGTRPPLAFVIEFMTTPRAGTLPRLGEYSLRVHREIPLQLDPRVPYRVLCAVVYLTGPEQDDRFGMTGDEADADGDVGLRLAVHRFTLSKEDAATTIEAVARSDVSRAALSFVPLMAGAGEPLLVGRWREVTEAGPDRQQQSLIGFLALTFAKLTLWSDVWSGGLEGMNVEKSAYWEEIRAGGRVEQARQDLVDMLQVRFGNEVSEELKPRVTQTTDLAVLKKCLLLIVPGNLEEVRKLLSTAK
jgi:hypothetical protein